MIPSDSGQVCTASSRAYIQKGAAEAFKRLLVARFEALKLGSPTASDTDLGPQADAIQAKAVARYLKIGNQDGKALTGGKASSVGDNYVQPTIFSNIRDDSRINVEEVFGPVLVLHEFETEREVIARANGTECKYNPSKQKRSRTDQFAQMACMPRSSPRMWTRRCGSLEG